MIGEVRFLRRRTTEDQNQSVLTYKELRMDIDGFHLYYKLKLRT